MNANGYLITEKDLGDTATKQDAEKMIELLRARGFNVEYGDPNVRRKPHDWDDNAAIDFETAILEEMINV